jgi:hypothetical protein
MVLRALNRLLQISAIDLPRSFKRAPEVNPAPEKAGAASTASLAGQDVGIFCTVRVIRAKVLATRSY